MTPTMLLRVLLCACCVMAAGIAWMWLASDRSWTPPPAHRVEAALLAPAPAVRRQSNGVDFATIAERPLFNADRRPPEPVDTAGLGPHAVRLIGLFASGQGGGAVLLYDDETRRIGLGEQLEGLSLREIGARHAILVGRDGEATRLELVRGRMTATEADTPESPPADTPFGSTSDSDDRETFPNHSPAPARPMTGSEP